MSMSGVDFLPLVLLPHYLIPVPSFFGTTDHLSTQFLKIIVIMVVELDQFAIYASYFCLCMKGIDKQNRVFGVVIVFGVAFVIDD